MAEKRATWLELFYDLVFVAAFIQLGNALTARVSPLTLKASQAIRLGRLFKGAVYKEDQAQVIFPIPKTPDLAGTIVEGDGVELV